MKSKTIVFALAILLCFHLSIKVSGDLPKSETLSKADDMIGIVWEETIDCTMFEIDYDNAKAVGYLNAIDKYVRKNPESELSKSFITGWIMKENVATVRLSNHSESVVKFIREELNCTDIVIEYGEGNWLDLEKQQRRLNEVLIRFYQEINEIEKRLENEQYVMDETERAKRALLTYYPAVTSDPYTGVTIARLTVSASAFEYIQHAVPKQGGTDEEIVDLPKTIRSADGFQEFLSGIDLFKRLIGDEQGVFYQAVEQKAPLKASEAEYSSWSPSRGIEVSSHPTNATPGVCARSGSTGF
ncbi:MAG: hypothetical protein IJM50_05555 [Lachnospiraceae bacterium]|nr:hypothetical protein [Lachnospiraceae bacterium]